MTRFMWAGLVALALVGIDREAFAQGAPAALALFEEGAAALAAGKLDVACAKLRASDELDPSVRARANLGECLERQGKLASAWAAYSAALKMLADSDPRYKIAKARVDALVPRLPRLQLVLDAGAPADTTVTEGATTVGAAATWGVALPFDAGRHHLKVHAGGKLVRELDVDLVEGQTSTVPVGGPAEPPSAVPVPSGPTAPPPASLAPITRPEPPPSDQRRQGAGPWILGGIGVASLAASAVLGGLTLHEHSLNQAGCNVVAQTCTQPAKDAAQLGRTLGAGTTATLIVGAAGVAGGAVWLGLRGPGPARARVGIGLGSLRVEGSW